jgi:glycosyltransferase involved in cell wall biosynthesis
VLSSIDHANQLISVDTNLINWIRATDISLSQKCIYLPNFVDIQQFQPVDHADGKIIILYPRRLSEARGFWLLVAIIPNLLAEHSNIQFHFCGIAESFEKVEINKLCELYAGKVLWYDVPPDQMPVVYQKADLVVIPTLYSEGTSLSCLEALASRRVVIATNVGGLTDIILPGFNGLLIEPNKEALSASINALINNRKLRETLASNGYQTVQVFDIGRWKDKWTSILKPYLVSSDDQRSKKTK